MTRNLALLHEDAFERRGDYDALWFEGRWHSSGELFERGRRVAAGLEVQAGDRVIVLMENSPDVPVAYHAIARAGAVATPVIFLLTQDELRGIVVDAEPALIITSPTFRDTVEQAAPGVRIVDDLAAAEADPRPIVQRREDDLAALVYTGGTTGRAKGVMLTHANLWEAGRRGHEAGDVPGITRSLTSLPLAHSFGVLVLNVGLHQRERAVSTLMRWFDPEAWLTLARDHGVQIAAVVPSMVQLLLAQQLEDYDLSELRYLATGAAPLPLEAIAEFNRRVPNVEIREGYGLTETSALVSTSPPGRIRHGTVGLPVPGTEVRIAEDGEVLVRSDLLMKGYWKAPELTAAVIEDGWLKTGDIGSLDEDGYLSIVDRKKDLILRGGFNVFPRDVEEALLEHPAITSACVVGRPDPTYGEEVVAFVTVSGGATPDDLVAFGRERLGGYKYPREIHVVDALPLTPVGKLDRKALREQLTMEKGAA